MAWIILASTISLVCGFAMGERFERRQWQERLDWAKDMEATHGPDWVEKLLQQGR